MIRNAACVECTNLLKSVFKAGGQCCSRQKGMGVPATLAMPPHNMPNIMAAPDGGINCTWYRWMKKEVRTVVISNNQTRVSSSYICQHVYARLAV